MKTVDQTVSEDWRNRDLDVAMGESVPPLTEAERAAAWDNFEPRHVTLSDEMYAPGVRRVRLGGAL